MKFLADLHVHSRFSIATARTSDIENLYISAQLKGITVVGTGDFTHPGWFYEIKNKLIPAEEGLYKLREDIAKICDQQVPLACRNTVRFILTTEISNIYKKSNKIRKNHNLIIIPDIDTAARVITKLDAIGNIKSDGRPILGLDAKDLLNILLEISDRSVLIPAHIWTPWFSVLGSKSGFDSIEECFEDLEKYIFAVETGLSSDPAMNWRVSMLDKYTLLSNSDAHSPQKLGREANIFNTELSYNDIYKTIKDGDINKFLGTYEFYPEEGKYHLDGHRKCKIKLWPKESIKNNGNCPECGKPLTLGVLYRVEAMTDRPEDVKPKNRPPFYNSIPLTEILSEILKVGPQTKKVQHHYRTLINLIGSEFSILHHIKKEDFRQAGIPLLAKAISRMRAGKICINPGFDGEFGKIKIFNPGEIEKYMGQKSLFKLPERTLDVNFTKKMRQVELKPLEKEPTKIWSKPDQFKTKDAMNGLNQKQLRAVHHEGGPLLIIAGPGTGKTRTLTHRIAYIIDEKGILPEKILAVTFTNKAAQEMRDRIESMNPAGKSLPLVTTFHGLCYNIIKELNQIHADVNLSTKPKTIIDETERIYYFKEAINQVRMQGVVKTRFWRRILEKIVFAKQMLLEAHENLEVIASGVDTFMLTAVYGAYQSVLSQNGLYDFEDLIVNAVKRLESDKNACKQYRERFEFIFVDEYQDINLGQRRLIRILAQPHNNICVIGDPDQSIYGFRGSDVKYFKRFLLDYPEAVVMQLTRNYRSTRTIVSAAKQIIQNSKDKTNIGLLKDYPKTLGKDEKAVFKADTEPIGIIEASSERAEAVAVGKRIEKMVGGTGFHFMDFGKNEPDDKKKIRSFSDFAILCRTRRQSRIFEAVFNDAGIPYQLVIRESLFASKGIPQLISLLKMISGNGSFIDIDRIKAVSTPAITSKILKIFTSWSFQHKITPAEALVYAGRFPVPGLGKAEQKRLFRFLVYLNQTKQATSQMTVRQKLLYLIELPHINTAIQSSESSKSVLNELLILSKNYGNRVSDFIVGLALQTDTDMYLPQAERVAIMTMHAAKGLEFPVVFICGCENGYIPLTRSKQSTPEIEEERRLLYVAMTRAKEKLFLTYATKRKIFGKTEQRTISPFVKHIDKHLKMFEAMDVSRKRNQTQLKLF